MSNLGNKFGFVMYTVLIYEQNVCNKESSRYAGPSLLQAARQRGSARSAGVCEYVRRGMDR